MKALGVLESKWDPIRQKLVRRLLEEQDEVLRWGTRGQRGGRDSWQRSGACQVGHVRVKQERIVYAEPRCMTKWSVRDE